MHKLVIPAILVSTILVAGVFAFVPVQQATAVHQQIIDALLAGDFVTASFLLNQLGTSHSNISGDIQNLHEWLTFQHFGLHIEHNQLSGDLANVSGHTVNLSGKLTGIFVTDCFGHGGFPTFPRGNFVCFGLPPPG